MNNVVTDEKEIVGRDMWFYRKLLRVPLAEICEKTSS